MALMDWIIIVVLVVSVLSAAKHGFFVEVFSLAGVVLGLLLASWNYERLLPWLNGWIHQPAIAQIGAFLAIALGVMIVAGLLGRVIRWSLHSIGLGWADRIVGAAFGLVKGCVLVTLAMMAITAFMPHTNWFQKSRLSPYFLSVAHQTASLTPSELGERIRQGVTMIRNAQPYWLKPNANLAPGPLQFIHTHKIESGTTAQA